MISPRRGFDLDEYRQTMQTFLGPQQGAGVFWSALEFAVNAHQNQWRRSGDPYIMHPCNVARILAEELDVRNPEILAASLLHDTLEDVDYVTTELLREKFGRNVEAIVEGCTKIAHYSGDKQAFKKLVHRKIFSGAAAKPEVMIVKLADRLHNLRTLSAMPKNKRQRIAEETLDIYAPLATVFGLFAIRRELLGLALKYKFPKQAARIVFAIEQLRNSPQAREIVHRLQKEFRKRNMVCKVRFRAKGLGKYYDFKNRILMKKIEVPLEILIITEDTLPCYQALGVLNQLYPPIPRTIRDFIANPKPTGYQGLHARGIIEGKKYLFKIRTAEMEHRAQRGLVREWTTEKKKRGRFIREMQEMFAILGQEESVSYRDLISARGRKEIYTYTPKGDLRCLPVNSIVLDFAFRVHTEVGSTCYGAMIGNRKVEADYVLHDGDVVRVLCRDHQIRFDPDIQKRCQTPRARSELARIFRERRQVVSREIGISILRQEMRRYGLPFEIVGRDEMGSILEYFGVGDLEGLFQGIGEGRIRLRELLYEIKNGLYVGKETLQQPTGIFNTVELETLDPACVKLSACCRPNPFDKGVFGLLSERGLSLHHRNCQALGKIRFQREDAVEVHWQLRRTKIVKPQKLIIFAINRYRLFMQLSRAPAEMNISRIVSLATKPSTTPAWEIDFTVTDLYSLKKIIRYMEKSNLAFEFALEQ